MAYHLWYETDRTLLFEQEFEDASTQNGVSETTGSRQMEMGFEIFCVGGGEHSSFFIFFPHTEGVKSNPSLHLTVSCRFRNSSGIKISSLSSSNSCTPLGYVHKTSVGEDILFCGRNIYARTAYGQTQNNLPLNVCLFVCLCVCVCVCVCE